MLKIPHCLDNRLTDGKIVSHKHRPRSTLPPTLLSLFPGLKLKYRHLDTIEVMEVESEAAMNSLTKHNSRMHLKWQKRWEVSPLPDGNTSSGNYGRLFVL
jgi:hypothetical protein